MRSAPLLFAGIALGATLLASPPSAEAVLVDHLTAHVSTEAMLPRYVHPPAVWHGGRVCIAFQGSGYDPMLATYEPDSGTWTGPTRIGINSLVLDSHGAPALFEDVDGNLHAVFGSHYTRMSHVRTASPGALEQWVAAPSVESTGTYPQVVTRPDGDVTIFYRGEKRRWWMRTSEGGTQPFGPRQMVLLPDSESAFYAHFRAGGSGRVHAAFVRLDLTQTVYERIALGRHDAYYMYMDVDGTWHNAAGDPVALPLTPTDARDVCMVYESPEVADADGQPTLETVTDISVSEDEAGDVCLLYLHGTGTGDGAYSWRFSQLTGDTDPAWRTSEIATTDHAYDAGGFAVSPGGGLEAFLNCDASDSPAAPRLRAGGIGRWTSTDGGRTWTLAETHVNPEEPLGRFAAPFVIPGAPPQARLTYAEWSDDWSNFFHRTFLWGSDGNVRRDFEPEAHRLAGPDRIATAVAISRESFAEGADAVLVATAHNFPDALAATPLAHALAGPVLLSPAAGLPPAVRSEITRLAPSRVILLGGEDALSEEVRRQAEAAAPGAEIERIWGTDRYGTMQAIASRLFQTGSPGNRAIVASGESWPDALAAGPLAAALECPVVLTRPNALSPQAEAVLSEWGIGSCIVAGGAEAISAGVLDRLPGAQRIGGSDRYETAALLGEYGLEVGLLPYRAVLVTGGDFPDALAASPFAARLQAPVLLAAPDGIGIRTGDFIGAQLGLYELYVAGGPAVVSETVRGSALALMHAAP
jgi:putative cell wall-binding protein